MCGAMQLVNGFYKVNRKSITRYHGSELTRSFVFVRYITRIALYFKQFSMARATTTDSSAQAMEIPRQHISYYATRAIHVNSGSSP